MYYPTLNLHLKSERGWRAMYYPALNLNLNIVGGGGWGAGRVPMYYPGLNLHLNIGGRGDGGGGGGGAGGDYVLSII